MIPAEEWITAEAEDAWLCICGNQSHLDGFWPCDAAGNEVEPVIAHEHAPRPQESVSTGGIGFGRCFVCSAPLTLQADGSWTTAQQAWDEKLVLCRRCGRIMDQSTYSGPGTWVLVVRGPGPMKLLEEAAP